MKFSAILSFFLFAVFSFIWNPKELVAENNFHQEHPWTLTELLDAALKNNPETQVAWWNAVRAAASLGSAKSAYYPNVDFNAGVSTGRAFKFTNGPDVNFTTVQAGIVFSFLIGDFGERAANVQAYQKALEAAGWQSNWSIQKVMADVLEKGYSTIAAQDSLKALYLSLEDGKKMLDAATHLNNAGLSPISDVYSSRAAFAQIKMEVAQQQAQLDIQSAKLATVLGFEVDIPIKLMPLDALLVPSEKLSELIKIAKETRQDLMAQRARLGEAIARKNQAVAKFGPKLRLNGVGGTETAFHAKETGLNFKIDLNLDIPLFTGFDATYQKRMAYADVKISEQELLQLELDIALDVLTQSRLVESSREMLIFAKESLENAQSAYNATLEKYHAGTQRIAEVSIALRQIINARVRYAEVHSRYLTAIANLAFATGTLSFPMEKSCIKK